MKRIQEQLPEMRRLWDQKVPAPEIARAVGCSIGAVNRNARHHGWEKRRLPPKRKTKHDWFKARLMWIAKEPTEKIAETLGTTREVVWTRARKENWPRRYRVGSRPEKPIPPIPLKFLKRHTKHKVRCSDCYAVYEAKFMMLGGIEHDHVCPRKAA